MTRSVDSAAKLQALGIQTHHGDLDDTACLRQLPLANCTLYYFAPPPSSGVIDSRMRHFITALNGRVPPRRIIYISTSGVYGDTEGEWVSEQSPVLPQAIRAKRRLDAETVLQHWCESCGISLTILRVAGIYGPHKLPIKRLQLGTAVLREEECGYTNRIHVEDLVNVCVVAAQQNEGFELYNVSDGHPGTMTGYFNAVADALALPRPTAITMEEAQQVLTPAMLSYLTESRRLDNSKLLRKLGITLQYPDLAAGLRGLHTKQQDQP
jgi:nucleoside-diphosphate-sugar epimerase